MHRIVSCTALFFLLGLIAPPSFADEAVLARVIRKQAIDCGYYVSPPYFDKDPHTGKASGINYEIMEAVGHRLNLTIKWVAEIGLGDVATNLGTKKIDVMCASLWPNASRIQTMTLTTPLFHTPVHAYVRVGDRRFDGDLGKANRSDIRISAIDGDFSYALAQEMFPYATLASLPSMASVSDVMLQVATRKADLVMMDQAEANEFMAHNKGALAAITGVAPIRVYSEHLFVKREEYGLRNLLDGAIKQLIDEGVIDQVLGSYNKKYQSDFIVKTTAQ